MMSKAERLRVAGYAAPVLRGKRRPERVVSVVDASGNVVRRISSAEVAARVLERANIEIDCEIVDPAALLPAREEAVKERRRPNEGARLMRALRLKPDDVAQALGVSGAAVRYWRAADRKPSPELRAEISDRYGIPADAWDAYDESLATKEEGLVTVSFTVTERQAKAIAEAPASTPVGRTLRAAAIRALRGKP